MGDFVVMPNHIHGILIIDKKWDNIDVDNVNIVDTGRIDTGHALYLPSPTPSPSLSLLPPEKFQKPGSQRFQNIGKNTISSIVGSYKSAVTKHANRLGYPHQWQKLFYDNII